MHCAQKFIKKDIPKTKKEHINTIILKKMPIDGLAMRGLSGLLIVSVLISRISFDKFVIIIKSITATIEKIALI